MRSLFVLLALVALSACAAPKGDTVAAKRSSVVAMRSETLQKFYAADPSLRGRIARAAGYAVFSNRAIRLFVVGPGHGYGVVRDNANGRDVYMRMGQLEVGVGLGARDLRALFLFKDAATLRSFVETGWQFGSNAEASAIVGGETGASVGAQGTTVGGGVAAGAGGGGGTGAEAGAATGSLGQGIEVYQLTETGIALSAGISGTKYWRDDELN